ncbi:hypothetical protein CBOM_07399 [Ceraceosorus bombacis]|uniref:Uncharacterized protein n=1 Tax=Ceraceosorus bombacis TaxID=401625 RepID=A0A0P1BAK1_9BASI|nr:hypothetical protein CBOM_07399 [Ceraceosorus bombacis]
MDVAMKSTRDSASTIKLPRAPSSCKTLSWPSLLLERAPTMLCERPRRASSQVKRFQQVKPNQKISTFLLLFASQLPF